MKFLASYIMRGRLEAMMASSVFAVLSLLLPPPLNIISSMLSSATLALVTLRKGAYEGLFILGSAGLAMVAMFAVVKIPYLVVVAIALGMWLPIWLIAIVLREGRHLSLAIEMAVLIGIVVIIGYSLFNADSAAMWKQVLPRMLPPNVQIEDKEQIINQLAPLMTGVSVSVSVYILLLSLFLGRWWQAMLYNPGGFKQEFLGLKVQSSVPLVSLAIIGIALISSGVISQIAWNSTIVMMVLYVFIGIAVSHTLFARMKIGQLAVPMFYITLVLIPYSLLPVALVGFGDTWMDLRNRI